MRKLAVSNLLEAGPPSTRPRRGESGQAAAIMPIATSLDHETLWQAVLEFIRHNIPHSSISLLLPDITSAESPNAREALKNRFKGYVLSPRVMASQNYLKAHPRAQIYTFSEILREDPTAAQRRETEGDADWQEFANLAFWSRRGQLRAILTIRRRPEHGSFTAGEFEFFRVLYPAVHAALERLASLEREHAKSLCFEHYVMALPLATMFVRGNGDLLFANSAAYDLCALWNFGPQQATSFNTRACFELPEAIAQTIQRVASAREAGEALPPEARVQHPRIPGLTATVRRVSDPRSAVVGASFVICLAYVDRLGNADTAAAPVACATLQLLTPAERKIALLVQDGLTNKEIAAKLSRSVQSVEWTLHSIYRKVGVASRTQLVRALLGVG